MVEREAQVDGVLEGLMHSVKIFGLYPKGDRRSLKDLRGVIYGGVIGIKLNNVHPGSA